MQESKPGRECATDTNALQQAPGRFVQACVCVALLLSSTASLAADALHGLTQRPANATCVAPALPVVATGTRIEQAFPAVSFRTVPDETNWQFRNGVIDMAQIPGDNDWWYVVERAGKVHRIANDDAATSFTTALDLTPRLNNSGWFEQWGIMSIAFHPDFANNGELYVLLNEKTSSNNPHKAILARYTSFDGGLTFSMATEEEILVATSINIYHQFGTVAFGPDGYLYASLGAPRDSDSQNVNDLHGSVLRIDVDGSFPYSIPAGNPFALGGGLPEIYAWGLRNPWRMSFDRVTGELWVGDVGESNWEEINRVVAGGNYGWDAAEGNVCGGAVCSSVTFPEYIYGHADGNSITGGYVYRGSAIPELTGRYLFGDAGGGLKIWAATYDASGNIDGKEVLVSPQRVTGFAEDQDGELLAVDLIESKVYRLLPETPGGGTAELPQKLSETGCVDPASPSVPASGLIPFDVNAPMWSDGAAKRRWLAIPDGTHIDVRSDGELLFPPGTVLMKEFSFNDVPVETRLFMRHPNGDWAGYSYEWDADLADATLLETGKSRELDNGVEWAFPSRTECAQCHSSANEYALGPKVDQLNRRHTYEETGDTANQLTTLEHIGLFAAPLVAPPGDLPALSWYFDIQRPLAARARSYLDTNCSYCHRPGGTTQSTMDLRYRVPIGSTKTCNLPPQHGDLGVPGALLIKPGSAAESVLSLRMHTTGSSRMPPLGTSLVDFAGALIVDTWIGASSVCDAVADVDKDDAFDDFDNCTAIANAGQFDSDGDGYGNACDADLNNDCAVNALDLGIFKASFFEVGNLEADFDGDGIVNSVDLGILKNGFFGIPGPSALSSTCQN